MQSSDDASLRTFIDEKLSPEYRAELGDRAIGHLQALRAAIGGATDGADVQRSQSGLLLTFRGTRDTTLRLAIDAGTGRITRLELHQPGGASPVNEAADTGRTGRRVAIDGHLAALQALAGAVTESALAAFQQRLAPAYVARVPETERAGTLEAIRREMAAAGAIMFRGQEDGIVVSLRGGARADVFIGLEAGPPYRITDLRLDTNVSIEGEGPTPPTLTWATLAEQLRAAEADGFAGTVLVVRDGRVVLHEGYGLADRESGRPNTVHTMFGIGSMPIDFTNAAVLLLVQRGVLSLNDPITRFLTDVPADKRTMTIEHLMTGRSGLPNFHHVAGVDANHDHSWIDRETAERRILGQTLLFPPGEGSSHSHSAFGLLAAIVERTSGMTYAEFLRRNFFAPAGMRRTGFYGETLGYADSEFAEGYGMNRASDPNIPPRWGTTSWLIMGSGGMFSTAEDMHRFFSTIESGAILTGAWKDRFLRRGTGRGVSDEGFYFGHATDAEGTSIYVASNVMGPDSMTGAIIEALSRLVLGDPGVS